MDLQRIPVPNIPFRCSTQHAGKHIKEKNPHTYQIAATIVTFLHVYTSLTLSQATVFKSISISSHDKTAS